VKVKVVVWLIPILILFHPNAESQDFNFNELINVFNAKSKMDASTHILSKDGWSQQMCIEENCLYVKGRKLLAHDGDVITVSVREQNLSVKITSNDRSIMYQIIKPEAFEALNNQIRGQMEITKETDTGSEFVNDQFRVFTFMKSYDDLVVYFIQIDDLE